MKLIEKTIEDVLACGSIKSKPGALYTEDEGASR